MKPRIIGRASIDLPKGMEDPAYWYSLDPGEVDSQGTIPDLVPDLIRVVNTAGYNLRKAGNAYPVLAFLGVNESVMMHTDSGSGMNAACVIHSSEPVTDECELITRAGSLRVRHGDVFVFNADVEHAWIGHGYCVLANAQITKRRRVSPRA